ncbi:hypothetical protein L195_g055305, partial [Trifolium pratense]
MLSSPAHLRRSYEHSSLPRHLKIFFHLFSLKWAVADPQQRQVLVSFHQNNYRLFDIYDKSLKNFKYRFVIMKHVSKAAHGIVCHRSIEPDVQCNGS